MRRIITALAMAFILCNSAHAACKSIDAPTLPDPDTAVLAQMVKAQNEVKAYIKAQQEYLNCTKSGLRYDRAFKQMQKVAKKFNTITRAYKNRS